VSGDPEDDALVFRHKSKDSPEISRGKKPLLLAVQGEESIGKRRSSFPPTVGVSEKNGRATLQTQFRVLFTPKTAGQWRRRKERAEQLTVLRVLEQRGKSQKGESSFLGFFSTIQSGPYLLRTKGGSPGVGVGLRKKGEE